MIDARDNEKKNKTIGFFTSLGIHSAVLLALIFLTGWKEPYPAPGASYGIELNFGLDDQGSGDVQPLTPVGTEQQENTETAKPQPEEEVKQVVKEEVKEEKTQLTSDEKESPVVAKEEPKKEKETKKEPVKEVVKEKVVETPPKVIAEYKKEDKKKTVTEGSKKGTAGNQGDDTGKTGDKGDPEGKLDAKALYGTNGSGGTGGNGSGAGGGDGLALQMQGWTWAEKTRIPDLPDNENGKVVFEIECDENGDIVSINTIERSLSATAENLLKKEIQRNSLIPTSRTALPPPRSKGRIIFVLKTK